MSDDLGEPNTRVPLVEEEIAVSKRRVDTGYVRLTTHVEKHRERIEEMLRHTDVEIDRVRVDRLVDEVPTVRMEGDTLVYPIVEEVIVKQLVLREEVRVTPRQRSEPFTQNVTLRSVRAEVERSSAPPRTATDPQTPEG